MKLQQFILPAVGVGVLYLIFNNAGTDQQDTSTVPYTPGTPTDFINHYLPLAQQVQSTYGVPAIVTLAVGVIESAYGTSNVATTANNFFGIKANSAWLGRNYIGYRAYDTPADSFNDYGNFLHSNPRYSAAFDYTDNAGQFIQAVAAAGYSENPAYLNTILKTMVLVQGVIQK